MCLEDQGCNEETGYDKEDVNANEPGTAPLWNGVERDDCQYRDGPQTVNVRPVAGL